MADIKNFQFDITGGKKANPVSRSFSMKELMNTKDIFSDAHDRNFCEKPLEIVDCMSDLRSRQK